MAPVGVASGASAEDKGMTGVIERHDKNNRPLRMAGICNVSRRAANAKAGGLGP
jgi:hypothetical protein